MRGSSRWRKAILIVLTIILVVVAITLKLLSLSFTATSVFVGYLAREAWVFAYNTYGLIAQRRDPERLRVHRRALRKWWLELFFYLLASILVTIFLF